MEEVVSGKENGEMEERKRMLVFAGCLIVL